MPGNLIQDELVQLVGLRCEYQTNPLGIDVERPRFSWIVSARRRGCRQSAYEIRVAESPAALPRESAALWHSGRVDSDRSIQIEYAGAALSSDTEYSWQVRVWDETGQATAWSEIRTFTTGLFSEGDWAGARWIAYKDEAQWRFEWEQRKALDALIVEEKFPLRTHAEADIWSLQSCHEPPYDPSPLLRTEFILRQPVCSAVATICGLGYYELHLNGCKVGDHLLDPAWTQYDKRVFYVTHDVAPYLRPGANALGVMLGRGWYNSLANDIWRFGEATWIGQPKMLLRLRVTLEDGAILHVVSGDDWRVAGGPILYDCTRHGELYDARLEKPGWDQPGCDDSDWRPAVVTNGPRGSLRAQMLPPIRATQKLRPVSVENTAPGVFVFDMGINMTGWARVRLQGTRGAAVHIRYAERYEDRNFVCKGKMALQQAGYILKGGDVESAEPKFSYYGFQYVQVSGYSGILTLDDLDGICVHTDVASVGEFTSSSPVLNGIQKNARRTFLNNFHSIQTDCPHREKMGWTADVHLVDAAAIYNFDMAAFYAKWLDDLADSQSPSGALPEVAPAAGYRDGQSVVWPAALAFVAWDLYCYYGDRRVLEAHYEPIRRFTEYVAVAKRRSPDQPDILTDVLGDWLPPVPFGDHLVMQPPEGSSIYATAAYCRMLSLLSRMAIVLGHAEEAQQYANAALRAREAYNLEFFDTESAVYHGENPTDYRQAPNAISLQYGLVPYGREREVAANLERDIAWRHGYHLDTGFLGTPAVMEALPSLGFAETACLVALQTSYPSWGYMIESGATTMWEDWQGQSSHNHPMYGCVSAYYFRSLAGIQPNPSSPGFKQILIRPQPFGDITWVKARYESLYGTIISEWEKADGSLRLWVIIPPNTTAIIYLPTCDVSSVREEGSPTVGSQGLDFIRMEQATAVFEAMPGEYHFEATLSG